jgi:hypothetical protein
MQRLLVQRVCAENGVAVLGDIPYGKGAIQAADHFHTFLRKLSYLRDHKKMNIILIAHDKTKRCDDPTTSSSYDRYSLDLHERIEKPLREWCDCILFATFDVSVKQQPVGFGKVVSRATGANRVIFSQERPAFLAGSRYEVPAMMPLKWEVFEAEYRKAVETIGVLPPGTLDAERAAEEAELLAQQATAQAAE